MNESDATTYMSLGMNTGVYLLASMIAEGDELSPEAGEILKRYASAEIEKLCDMPAEDFANHIQAIVDDMRRTIKRVHDAE